jgi:hypothetical protein
LPELASPSPRLSRWPQQAGQIDVTLDPAQGLVVDGFFVAQFDHGVAFCLNRKNRERKNDATTRFPTRNQGILNGVE